MESKGGSSSWKNNTSGIISIEKYLLRTVITALFFYLIFSPVYFFHYVMVCPLLAMRISHM